MEKASDFGEAIEGFCSYAREKEDGQKWAEIVIIRRVGYVIIPSPQVFHCPLTKLAPQINIVY